MNLCGSSALLAVFVLLSASAGAQPASSPTLEAVTELDLDRYMGVWHEVARLPFRFQAQCVGDVTASYTRLADGDVLVVNRCRTKDGTFSEAKGKAKRAGKNDAAGKLKVRFAPAFLSFLPLVWGDYWLVELAPDYSYAAVGEPGRKYLWILSRTPAMDEDRFQQLTERLSAKGYDLSRLLRAERGDGR